MMKNVLLPLKFVLRPNFTASIEGCPGRISSRPCKRKAFFNHYLMPNSSSCRIKCDSCFIAKSSICFLGFDANVFCTSWSEVITTPPGSCIFPASIDMNQEFYCLTDFKRHFSLNLFLCHRPRTVMSHNVRRRRGNKISSPD